MHIKISAFLKYPQQRSRCGYEILKKIFLQTFTESEFISKPCFYKLYPHNALTLNAISALVLGELIGKRQTMSTVGENMQLAVYALFFQRHGKKHGIFRGNHIIRKGVPDKGRGSVLRHLLFKGDIFSSISLFLP